MSKVIQSPISPIPHGPMVDPWILFARFAGTTNKAPRLQGGVPDQLGRCWTPDIKHLIRTLHPPGLKKIASFLCFHRLLRFIAHLNVEKLSSQSDRMRDSCLAATNDLVGLCSRSDLDSEKYFGIQSEPHVIVSVISEWLC